MILTQILQKIKSVVYTKSQIDSMGGGNSLDTTIRSKQNALSTAQLSAVNSGITSNKVSQYDEYISGASGQPVGTIAWVMGSTVPAGYLICNGSAVSRTAYDKLFQAIGTKYGEGDGSTTFNLPNLIDRFLQGSETSGTIKDAGLPNITGALSAAPRYTGKTRADTVYARAGAFSYEDSETWGYDLATEPASSYSWHLIKLDASKSNSIYGSSSTVQPPSVTSIPCIKAFDSVIDATTVSVAQLSDTKLNKDLSNLDENGRKVIADLLPIGSYIQFAGSQAPAGFLVCNGGEISRTTYSALFAVIGTTYGSGDGSTTFNLPNLTDRFLQGSATSGTVKDAGLPDITGSAGASIDTYHNKSSKTGAFSSSVYTEKIHAEETNEGTHGDDWEYNLNFNASNSNSIYGNSSTVQPPALTCLICIKY